jgi:hypothetical protein
MNPELDLMRRIQVTPEENTPGADLMPGFNI